MIDPQRLKPSFILSAAHFRDVPEFSSAEFCIAGRSNVGKSSFINHALNRRGLARVSKRPGKTRLANFYHITDTMLWVDLPGYGYAQAPGTERLRWAKLIEEYFARREALSGVIWLVDIRHPSLNVDTEAYRWFLSLGLPIFAVMTKCDKLGVSARKQHAEGIRAAYPGASGFVEYTVESNAARDSFWAAFSPWAESLMAQGK